MVYVKTRNFQKKFTRKKKQLSNALMKKFKLRQAFPFELYTNQKYQRKNVSGRSIYNKQVAQDNEIASQNFISNHFVTFVI